MYHPLKLSNSEFVCIRNQNYHVRVWGDPKRIYKTKPLVLLHGWMDVSASFQFLVDAFNTERLIIAPDWRGFGLTTSNLLKGEAQDHFVFADYLGDLEFLLDHYFQDQPIDLLGHSMGANICMLYAGIRPARINKLINLEGFGMPKTRPSQAPTRYVKWLDELKQLYNGEIKLKTYDSSEAVAKRLLKNNPRISNDKALWLAMHWAREEPKTSQTVDSTGTWHLLGSPAHKITSANLYNVEETREVHRRITAPLLCVTAEEDSLKKWFGEQYKMDEFYERMTAVSNITYHQIKNTGHMLHHDQPEVLAQLIDSFLT